MVILLRVSGETRKIVVHCKHVELFNAGQTTFDDFIGRAIDVATVKCASVNSILSNVLTSSDLGLLHRKKHLFAIFLFRLRESRRRSSTFGVLSEQESILGRLGHCSTRFDTMMAVARAPVGVATAVTTVSGSSSMRRRAGFGHVRVRCEMERVVADTAMRTSGGNANPGRWEEIQDQHHSSLNVDDAARPRAKNVVEEDAEVLIECRNVYKSFGEKHILRGASFKIRHGEAVGIIGPSGTGKSTVLRIIAGLLAPDKGEVYIRGKKREGLASDADLSGLRIGLVFQSAALFDSLTVRENVGFMLYEHTNLSDEKIAELVRESLAAVGLKGVEERLPSELSGGMKKRVALARAIISDGKPGHSEQELVMYDEPTAGLDPIASTVVEDLIRSVHINGRDAQGKPGTISSYVVVTHQHSTIRRAVDRILFLHEGQVVWEGLTAEFDTSINPIVRQFADGSLLGPIRY